MKKILAVFLFVYIFLFTTQSSVHALIPPIRWSKTAVAPTMNPTGVPQIFNQSCGFADNPDANMCCEKVEYLKKNKNKVKELLDFIPFVPSFITDFLADPLAWTIANDPITPKLESSCYTGSETIENITDPNTGKVSTRCLCKNNMTWWNSPVGPTPTGGVIGRLCEAYPYKTKEREACFVCASNGRLLTAVGCVPIDFGDFITNFLLKTGIGFAGLYSLGCIIYSAIMIQISQGNSEKISQAQDQIKACIFGLLLVMFSILILRLIGVTILELPFFS